MMQRESKTEPRIEPLGNSACSGYKFVLGNVRNRHGMTGMIQSTGGRCLKLQQIYEGVEMTYMVNTRKSIRQR